MSATKDRRPSAEERTVETVRDRYGRIATGETNSCCGGGEIVSTVDAEKLGYEHSELAVLPDGANLGLGCGAPVSALELRPGETMLDLGSGAGIDAFVAADQVGPEGKVIGVDMTPAMLEKARENASKAGVDNVDFREGRLEALPVEDASVDAVTSNCVVNLVPDKAAVFAEVFRVLKPGGRVVISDIMLEGELPEAVRSNAMAWVGCVAGAVQRSEYFEIVERAGLKDVTVIRNLDYLTKLTACGGEPGWMQEAGVRGTDLAGVVQSVTFRAVKPRRGSSLFF
jgi:SAM-dependent methyltransferase